MKTIHPLLYLSQACSFGCVNTTLFLPPTFDPPPGAQIVHIETHSWNNIEVKLREAQLGEIRPKQEIVIEGKNYLGRIVAATYQEKAYTLHCFNPEHSPEVCKLHDSSQDIIASLTDALGHLEGSVQIGTKNYPITNSYGPEDPKARAESHRSLTKVIGAPHQASIWFSPLELDEVRYLEMRGLSEQERAVFQIFSAFLIQDAHWRSGPRASRYPFVD